MCFQAPLERQTPEALGRAGDEKTLTVVTHHLAVPTISCANWHDPQPRNVRCTFPTDDWFVLPSHCAQAEFVVEAFPGNPELQLVSGRGTSSPMKKGSSATKRECEIQNVNVPSDHTWRRKTRVKLKGTTDGMAEFRSPATLNSSRGCSPLHFRDLTPLKFQ